jgi:hypothetical protein
MNAFAPAVKRHFSVPLAAFDLKLRSEIPTTSWRSVDENGTGVPTRTNVRFTPAGSTDQCNAHSYEAQKWILRLTALWWGKAE